MVKTPKSFEFVSILIRIFMAQPSSGDDVQTVSTAPDLPPDRSRPVVPEPERPETTDRPRPEASVLQALHDGVHIQGAEILRPWECSMVWAWGADTQSMKKTGTGIATATYIDPLDKNGVSR